MSKDCFDCTERETRSLKCCKIVSDQEQLLSTANKRIAELEDTGWDLYFQTEMMTPNAGCLEKWASINGVTTKPQTVGVYRVDGKNKFEEVKIS